MIIDFPVITLVEFKQYLRKNYVFILEKNGNKNPGVSIKCVVAKHSMKTIKHTKCFGIFQYSIITASTKQHILTLAGEIKMSFFVFVLIFVLL